MNWNMIISGFIIVVIKVAGMTVFLLYFPQGFGKRNDGFIPTESYGTTNVQNVTILRAEEILMRKASKSCLELKLYEECLDTRNKDNRKDAVWSLEQKCFQQLSGSDHVKCVYGRVSQIFGRNNESVMPTRSYGTACPKDWDLHQGRCFFFSTSESSWNNSRDDCTTRGSTLAVVDTPEKLKYLQDIANAEKYFVGLTRQSRGKPWRWVNNSAFNGNVTNENQNFHCVTIGLTKTFDAASCDISYRWICERTPR